MKVIIKIGTSSLVTENRTINQQMIINIAKSTKELMMNGNDVMIVTSGAVGCGKSNLKEALEKNMYIKDKEFCKKKEFTTSEKTLLSGIGQKNLLSYYWVAFEKTGLLTEQMLIAGKKDLENSTAEENIDLCFKLGIVPIVNANDTVYNKELLNERFDDNDTLSSEIAKTIGADALFLVTNVDGYLDKSGNVIDEINCNQIDDLIRVTDKTTSKGGTGGMVSKLNAAKNSGCDTYILSNKQVCNINRILQGERIGTKISIKHNDKTTVIERIKELVNKNENRVAYDLER